MNLPTLVAVAIELQKTDRYKDSYDYALDIYPKGSALRKTVAAQGDAIETLRNLLQKNNPDKPVSIISAAEYICDIENELKKIGFFNLGMLYYMSGEGRNKAESQHGVEREKAESLPLTPR